MNLIGEIAALGTAVCWSFTSLFFTSAGRRIGSFVMNQIRIPIAVVFLTLSLLATKGAVWPVWVDPTAVGLLCLSGLIGLVLGDSWYFQSLVLLGPRRATLLMSLAPAMTALLAWPILGEGLSLYAIAGVAVTMAGIFWVVLERREMAPGLRETALFTGVLAGIGGALGQAGGLVIAKLAMQDSVDALSATVIRMDAAFIGVWIIGAVKGTNRQVFRVLKLDIALAATTGGAFCGPFLGVWLSLFAVKHTEAAIAATLMATVPVVVIPLVILFHRERPSARAVLGAIVAVAGVAMLFLR